MPSYKWLLKIEPEARKNVAALPTSALRMSIFRSIRELLEADNPFFVSDVLKIKKYKNVWRKRQGDYRIFFTLNSTPVKRDKHQYKGTLYLLTIRKRDESTYE